MTLTPAQIEARRGCEWCGQPFLMKWHGHRFCSLICSSRWIKQQQAQPKARLKRFEAKFIPEPNSGCWLWQGNLHPTTGYGQLTSGGKHFLAHRWAYEHYVGPIPEGLQLDHKCRLRCCVNPDHLEPVTCKENNNRGISAIVNRALALAQTHCRHGHPYDASNSFIAKSGFRVCRICRNARYNRYIHGRGGKAC